MSHQLVRRSTGGRGRAFFQRWFWKQRGERRGEQSGRSSGLLCGASASGRRGSDRAQGFTLLEVLIAVLVFAIGALAVAQMQVNGMRLTANASDRLRAVWLAGSMAERMRANRVGVSDLAYNGAATSGGPNCGSASCTPAELAVYHSVAWTEEIQKVLPDAAGVVCIDSTPNDGDTKANLQSSCDGTGDRYAIKVAWVDSLLQNSATGATTEEALSIVFAWPRRIRLAGVDTSGGTGT